MSDDKGKPGIVLISTFKPLNGMELEAADIANSAASLFQAIAIASPPAIGKAGATITRMIEDIREDEEESPFSNPLIRLLENTLDTMAEVVAAHMNLRSCTGECDGCDRKPDEDADTNDECYAPDSKKTWS